MFEGRGRFQEREGWIVMQGRSFPEGLTLEGARQALRDYADMDHMDPRANSVFMLGQALFSGMESGSFGMEDLSGLICELHEKLAWGRAEALRKGHGMDEHPLDPFTGLKDRLRVRAEEGWEAFQETVESFGRLGLVFTAHPTFGISLTLRQALGRCASYPGEEARDSLSEAVRGEEGLSPSITLDAEHEETQIVLGHARRGLCCLARIMLEIARFHFPKDWRRLRLCLPTLASWVGYDLDGRTDIEWYQTVSFRLSEKRDQLEYYAASLSEIGGRHQTLPGLEGLIFRLRRAAASSAVHAAMFADIGDSPEALVSAANALTAEGEDRLVDMESCLQELDGLLELAPDICAMELLVVRAEMQTFGFSTAHIHLRINAAQIGTIIRRDLGLETEDMEPGRLAMRILAGKASSGDRREVSFADLYLEHSTAHRQFMLSAQILKHIDSRTPIRFLIAEAENPATVMAALYLARLYGVEGSLDISPLFETPDALESGGRFIRTLLQEGLYRDYVSKRGRLCIQLGFSDSGRFIGQIAANMAIERIHNLILGALREYDLEAEVVFFNTHGESMGRGAYPATLRERFELLLTGWVRRQAASSGQKVRHEVSFQGGDGFLHFASAELAQSAIAVFCCSQMEPLPEATDSFYSDGVFVWDFYRHLRRWHEEWFSDSDYARVLDHFADGVQIRAGSRPVRRRKGGGPANLRAISHNAILQQLGMPLNVACGIGSAMQREVNELVSLVNCSDRMRALMSYAFQARGLSSIPALRAYASVYDPGLWVALADKRNAGGSGHSEAWRRIAASFSDCATSLSISRMSNKLAVDLHQFDTLLRQLGEAPSASQRHEDRLDLHVLHAVRVALMMRLFLLAGSLRAFSPRHDIGLDEITHLITGLATGEAIIRLEKIFPKSEAGSEKLNAIAESGHRSLSSLGYARFHEEIVVPLKEIDEKLHLLKVLISHVYSGYG